MYCDNATAPTPLTCRSAVVKTPNNPVNGENNMKKLQTLALVTAVFGISSNAIAVLPTVTLDNPATTTEIQVDNAIQSRILASVVSQDAQGQEVLSPITAQTRLASGNVVEYRGYLTNHGTDRVRNMKVTMNIPANMELLSTTDVMPERAYGSTDGNSFHYMPLKANMGGSMQNLPMSYYKAVQWDITGLGLNEVAMVKYRLKVK
jgi:hypothetical protein